METKTKYKAVFKGWDGKEYTLYIGKELIDDIVFAVKAQMLVKSKNVVINGFRYCNVDIFEA